jgi:hypothetical protein
MEGGTTIVTCVEAGPLEAHVLMLAESLRAFGGVWAKTDFVAVKPRRGPGISSRTKREFKHLDVEFIDDTSNTALDWWSHANKSSAMCAIETRISTPNITWMDGDMIVLQPLDDLAPSLGAQFIARPGESGLASDGSDENVEYWRRVCELFGLNFDSFPVITSFPEGRQVRAYWQGGIFSYATRLGLGRAQHEIIRKLLPSKVGSKQAGVYHQDQVSLALAVQKLSLKHAEFHPSMNYNLNVRAKKNADILPMQDVKILHYHDSFYPPGLGWAVGYVERLEPDRVELIRKYTPFSANASLLARAHKKVLSVARQRRAARFEQQAVLY